MTMLQCLEEWKNGDVDLGNEDMAIVALQTPTVHSVKKM